MGVISSNLSSWFSSNPTIKQTSSTRKTVNLTLKTGKSPCSSAASNAPKGSKTSVQDLLVKNGSSRYCLCCPRRDSLGVLGTGLPPVFPSFSADEDPMAVVNRIHPPRPDWYEEIYALAMEKATKAYEAEIAGYKSQLFASLRGKVDKILEIGIGTGPNLKYYADYPGVNVCGVDPIRKMEKYARAAAENAGLSPSNFEFMQAVAEALPLDDASVDAVVGTLVLCSVKDVDRALQEVKRVLKPGGFYVFVEHVAAKDGTILRFVQGILNPLQQTVADGCHLTRKTATNIAEAGFASLDVNEVVLSTAFITNPQVYGIAYR
ncbi:putative methyltransferase [Handroanthus impetiginosus]|uniref:Putative methyltransferase n=1 Tax=Handroanthus impetiginosus TaxID=429701 RepID=A0A2G9H8B8_9LAMI|nr:putative methyltransferase [Handroanthus impetiginosus]